MCARKLKILIKGDKSDGMYVPGMRMRQLLFFDSGETVVYRTICTNKRRW